jgi:hypothetical protein
MRFELLTAVIMNVTVFLGCDAMYLVDHHEE